jgi:tRNA (cytidine/uridine-2'-O-)-methyltransferase
MFHIILYEPEIPPNTGNIMRLCANTGCHLHLIHPLGFELDDKRMRRAGLDYMDWNFVNEYPDYKSCLQKISYNRLFACSTKGTKSYAQVKYEPNDAFVFGPETRGLPSEVLDQFPTDQVLRLAMLPESRSMNLSNACAIFLFEAWRQNDFAGAI